MKQEFNFEVLIDKLKGGEHFSWSRFGDGEWSAILQNRKEGGMNCDGHHFFPDMGQELKNILERRPNYFIGLQNLAREQNQNDPEFTRLVDMNEWCDNEILHRASIKGYLDKFFDVLNNVIGYNRICIIGNDGLDSLSKIKNFRLIPIPSKDCWLERDRIQRQIEELKEYSSYTTYLYCASMMSNYLIDKNHGPGITQIDCGSVFDPYVGKLSRSYMKKLELK